MEDNTLRVVYTQTTREEEGPKIQYIFTVDRIHKFFYIFKKIPFG